MGYMSYMGESNGLTFFQTVDICVYIYIFYCFQETYFCMDHNTSISFWMWLDIIYPKS